MNNIEICSKALNKIGAIEIQSFEDATPESEIARSMYAIVKRKLLSSFAWSFATEERELMRVQPDDGERGNAFALPEDFIRAIRIEPAVSFRISGPKIITSAESVRLSYIADAEEENFPPMFAAALISSLAAEFAFALLDDGAKFNMMQRQALSELKEARFIESQQGERRRIKNFTLNMARN